MEEREFPVTAEMNTPEIVQTLLPVAEVLEHLGVAYHLGGSVASSLYGQSRPTQDIDLVASLELSQVKDFVDLLNQLYYVDEDMIRDAIRTRSSFSVIYHTLGLKIDIFLPKLRAFDQDEMQYVQHLPLEAGGRVFPIASAEAMILHKLEWYELGNRVSKRQWRDLLGMIEKKAHALDFTYLNRWAGVLRVQDLLMQALQEAGIVQP